MGRALWLESDEKARLGYLALFKKEVFNIYLLDPIQTVIFPELEETVSLPEINMALWNILGENPQAIMCSSSQMVVKRKAFKETRVITCTLLPYEEEFDLGSSLKDAKNPFSPTTLITRNFVFSAAHFVLLRDWITCSTIVQITNHQSFMIIAQQILLPWANFHRKNLSFTLLTVQI